MFKFRHGPDLNIYQYSSYSCHFSKKKCTAPLFSSVEHKLDVGLPPNHHVGNIPIIQFGEGLPVSVLPGQAQTCQKRFMSH